MFSGDTFDDVGQVVANAYDLKNSTVSTMAEEVKTAFEAAGGADFVHFVGYSGGGVAATRVVEKLEDDSWGAYISSVIRVGSPELYYNSNRFHGRITDFSNMVDPIPSIEIPRVVSWTTASYIDKTIFGLKYAWWNPLDAHTSYFSPTLKDRNGVTNLTKTVEKVISYFK